MILDKPYFMENENWYFFDENEFIYKLTDKATEKAQKSYLDFYNTLGVDVEIRRDEDD